MSREIRNSKAKRHPRVANPIVSATKEALQRININNGGMPQFPDAHSMSKILEAVYGKPERISTGCARPSSYLTQLRGPSTTKTTLWRSNK